MSMFYFKEGGLGGKLMRFQNKVSSLAVVIFMVSTPTILFLLTGKGWLSLLSIVALGLSFNKLVEVASRFGSDKSIIPKHNNLTSVGGYPSVN